MIQQLEAVYENGVLRPLGPLSLTERQRVQIIVTDRSLGPRIDEDAVERARAEVAAGGYIPTIEEVRAITSKIPGNLSDDVIRERGDY